jgi:hypothetical protein
MTTIIKDGTGKGYSAKVISDGKIATVSEIYSMQAHASMAHERAYQVNSGERTVTSAGAYGILALRNDASSDYCIVTYIRMGLNQVETAEAKFETFLGGTWSAGTAVTPVNMHIGSPNSPSVTAHYNSIPTGATMSDMCYLRGPNEKSYNKEGAMNIPPGEILSIKVTTTTDATKVYARISFVCLTETDLMELR